MKTSRNTATLHLKSLLITALASATLSNCSHTWSEAQKRSVQDVSLATPTMAKDGYKSADAVSLATQGKAKNTAMGFGIGGGAIGAVVGGLVVGGVTAAEGSGFRSEHAAILAKLDEQMKQPVTSDLSAAYTEVLKKDPFMGPKFRQDSQNRIEVEVIAYGLARVAGKDEDLFTPYLTTAVTLKTAAGKSLLNRQVVYGRAALPGNGTGYPLHQLAQDKKLMRSQWERAVKSNGTSLGLVLKQRHGQ